MKQNNFAGLVFPAVAGFFWFGKQSQVEEYQVEKPRETGSADTSGLSGVEKYLKSQKDIQRPTGVDKYLDKLEKNPATGVTKYLRKVAIAEKQAPAHAPLSGVEKYLKNQKEVPRLSNVAKYIKKQDHTPATRVAKYMARQTLAAKQRKEVPVASSVAKYLEKQAQVSPSGVAKYLAKQAIAEREMAARKLADAAMLAERAKLQALESATGVEKYLRNRG